MGIKGSSTSWSVGTSGISIYGHKGESYILVTPVSETPSIVLIRLSLLGAQYVLIWAFPDMGLILMTQGSPYMGI